MPDTLHEDIRTPDELDAKCPRCHTILKTILYHCDACGYDLTDEEIGNAGRDRLMAFFERERRDLQTSQSMEIRMWQERDPDVDLRCPPSHWAVIGYANSRQSAAILASALHHQAGYRLQVWCLRPLHKHLGARQLYDEYPRRSDYDQRVLCTCDFCTGRRKTLHQEQYEQRMARRAAEQR